MIKLKQQIKNSNIVYIALVAATFWSCSDQTATKGINSSKAEIGEGEGNGDFSESGGDKKAPELSEIAKGKFLDAEYRVKITAAFLEVCGGDIKIALDPTLGASGGQMFDFKSTISCLGQEFDLGEMLKGAGGDAPPEIEIKDNVIGFKSMGAVSFQPSRPLIPSFLATKKSKLKSLAVTREVALWNKETGDKGKGSVSLTVTEFGVPYTPPDMVKSFKNTLTFNSQVTGFSNIKSKLTNMLFDKFEAKISLDPIAIPYFRVEFKAEEAAAGGLGGGAGGAGGLGGLLNGGGLGGDAGGAMGPLIKLAMKIIVVKAEAFLISQEGVEDSSFDSEDEVGNTYDDDED